MLFEVVWFLWILNPSASPLVSLPWSSSFVRAAYARSRRPEAGKATKRTSSRFASSSAPAGERGGTAQRLVGSMSERTCAVLETEWGPPLRKRRRNSVSRGPPDDKRRSGIIQSIKQRDHS
ncbi:hypothetical protein IWX90DRAFT_219244 [Phyllosticta citrichinensis]|uniref:Secreted protein n=1 Tax=Phyllosticta citrichinensis TaxID=1130410 RepID=A0ABR1XTN3_9PEZI